MPTKVEERELAVAGLAIPDERGRIEQVWLLELVQRTWGRVLVVVDAERVVGLLVFERVVRFAFVCADELVRERSSVVVARG